MSDGRAPWSDALQEKLEELESDIARLRAYTLDKYIEDYELSDLMLKCHGSCFILKIDIEITEKVLDAMAQQEEPAGE